MILKKYKLTNKDRVKMRKSYPYTNMSDAKPGFSVSMMAGSPEEFLRPSAVQGTKNTIMKFKGIDLALY